MHIPTQDNRMSQLIFTMFARIKNDIVTGVSDPESRTVVCEREMQEQCGVTERVVADGGVELDRI